MRRYKRSQLSSRINDYIRQKNKELGKYCIRVWENIDSKGERALYGKFCKDYKCIIVKLGYYNPKSREFSVGKSVDIKEGNKLIAEFMLRDEDLYQYTGDNNKYKSCKYHSSWDWLMPVVEKITSIDYQYPCFHAWDLYGGIKNSLYNVDIKETYKYVIEFIQWRQKKGE